MPMECTFCRTQFRGSRPAAIRRRSKAQGCISSPEVEGSWERDVGTFSLDCMRSSEVGQRFFVERVHGSQCNASVSCLFYGEASDLVVAQCAIRPSTPYD